MEVPEKAPFSQQTNAGPQWESPATASPSQEASIDPQPESPVPEPPRSGTSSEKSLYKSLSRFRLAVWGLWLFYTLAVVVLYIRVQGLPGFAYGMAFAIISTPGAVALFFWKVRGAQYLSKGLYLWAGNLSVAAFFANFFLLYAILKHFVSDDSALLSLSLLILNACMQGALVWMIFFKKDAPYLTN